MVRMGLYNLCAHFYDEICWHLNVKNYHRAPLLFYRFSFSSQPHVTRASLVQLIASVDN